MEQLARPVMFPARLQAFLDGVLIDVSEWASAETGFGGGFIVPVAITAAVWGDICEDPAAPEDVRERSHAVLASAAMAAKGKPLGSWTCKFAVNLSAHSATEECSASPAKQTYLMVCMPDDGGAVCITIMRPDEQGNTSEGIPCT